jgi:hypothetical protein
MAKKTPAVWVDELATWVAEGNRIGRWPRITNGECSERQARRYASQPEFKTAVQEHRAEITRATLGTHTLLAEAATAAALHMIKHSKSDGVRVAIYRAVVGSQIALDTHTDLAERIKTLEQAHEQQQQQPPSAPQPAGPKSRAAKPRRRRDAGKPPT